MSTRNITVTTLFTLLGGTLLGGSLVGCTAQLGDGEFHGHNSQEMQVSLDELDGSWHREGEWLVSPVLPAPDGASRVGVFLGTVDPGSMPTVQARPLDGAVPAGDWVDVSETWGEVDDHVGIAELGTTADGAQLRIRQTDADLLRHFRWNAVIPEVNAELDSAAGDLGGGDLGGSREALRSELSALGIVTRESWGARRTRCSSRNASKTRMAIHHTVTGSSNPERQVRGIQRYHMDSRGWCDVGYHFLVGIDGTIYEGRPLELRGAHVGGQNTGNIGISFVGCFNSSGCSRLGPTRPSDASIQAAGQLVGALSRIYGISINTTRVKGHRDHSGASTSCPGSYLYSRLDEIRSIGRTGGASPTPTPTPTPSPTPTPTEGASCGHSYGGTYANTACSAGYQCCDGRWRVRGSSSSCGSCLCVEESGRTGCSGASTPTPPPAPTPPPGASCGHTYGGSYANTACSAGYQCCDGRWRVRGSSSSCGSCFCVEESGRSGCGT